jgi:hypothetical protein
MTRPSFNATTKESPVKSTLATRSSAAKAKIPIPGLQQISAVLLDE